MPSLLVALWPRVLAKTLSFCSGSDYLPTGVRTFGVTPHTPIQPGVDRAALNINSSAHHDRSCRDAHIINWMLSRMSLWVGLCLSPVVASACRRAVMCGQHLISGSRGQRLISAVRHIWSQGSWFRCRLLACGLGEKVHGRLVSSARR